MNRRVLITALVFGTFLFLVTAALLARALSGPGTERARVLDVLRAQARGDAGAVLRQLPACAAEPACVRTTQARVAQLRSPGDVEILRYQPSVQLALVRTRGVGRVAWRVGAGLPVVQCVRVVRFGPLSRDRVELLALSDPIGRENSC